MRDINRNDNLFGPAAVFAGAKVRADGSVVFVRALALALVDELGYTVWERTPRDLGIVGLHHDVIELPNGNFLALGSTFRDIEYPDLGLTHVAGDLLVEIDAQTGAIVWEWDTFDHLDPQRRRAGFETLLLDPQTGIPGQDWTHGNGVVFDARTNTYLLSLRHQDWLVAIDADSGDVVWRLGEEGDLGLQTGTWFYHQHSPQRQQDGTLLLYDNGLGNPNLDDALETSRAIRYAVDPLGSTASVVWEDEAEDFMSPIAGDADRLPNGRILVTDSTIDFSTDFATSRARLREIDEATSATPHWSLTTELGAFVYRALAVDRLPGEAVE